ncbi:MAG: hypothetical protein OES13_02030 [Acidimicrobiia bacterium]|nr:hypothetical protein [Acidimicrobiia bacterium]
MVSLAEVKVLQGRRPRRIDNITGLMLLGVVVFLVIVFLLLLLLRNDGDGEAPVQSAPPAAAAAVTAGEAGSGAEGSGVAGEQPEGAAGVLPGQAVAACDGASYIGTAFATVTPGPSGETSYATAEFRVDPDCVTQVDILWMGLEYHGDWVTQSNPGGTYCSMVEGDGGTQFYSPDVAALTLTPDGQGGGTLSGWLTISSGGMLGACPPPAEVDHYIYSPRGALFAGTIANGQRAGSANFVGDTETVELSVAAAEADE